MRASSKPEWAVAVELGREQHLRAIFTAKRHLLSSVWQRLKKEDDVFGLGPSLSWTPLGM
jgi:hypothetical protein